MDEWVKQMYGKWIIKYYLVIKKKGILLFATALMEFERIRICEMSGRERKNTVWSHIYVEFKRAKHMGTE